MSKHKKMLTKMNVLTLTAACALCMAAGSGRAQTPPAVVAALAGHAAMGPEVLVNDNNFPYSSGREIGKPDANELTLLDIRALVEAR